MAWRAEEKYRIPGQIGVMGYDKSEKKRDLRWMPLLLDNLIAWNMMQEDEGCHSFTNPVTRKLSHPSRLSYLYCAGYELTFQT